MKLFTLIAICLNLLLQSNIQLEYLNGRPVRTLIVHFDHTFSIMPVAKSRPMTLVLKNTSRLGGFVRGEARGCQIGKSAVAASEVKVFVNNLASFPVPQTTQNIEVQVHIQNTGQKAGNIECKYLALLHEN